MAREGPRPHCLSVDVEDHFHSEEPDLRAWDRYESRIERSTRGVLEICAAAGVHGTFFVLGWVAERHPGVVRAIAADGHEVASHGYAHEFVYRQSPARFTQDVRRAKQVLEDLTGTAVRGYRAPYFSIVARTAWAYDCLLDAGYEYSSSVFPGANPRYGIPSHPREPLNVMTSSGGRMREVPVTTFLSHIGCGGVYFRALPFRIFAAQLRRHERSGHRAVFYIHPWELDADKPSARGSLGLRLRHDIGVRSAAARLRRLLALFEFGPVGACAPAPGPGEGTGCPA
jgi:polysaccharide deacetylase family protein (PEP-CTERM system associated)